MISEALQFWNTIAGKVKGLIKTETQNAFRAERYEVTTAPDGTKIGVTLPMGTNEIFLPYSREVANATVGASVLVVWWGSMSNAKVYYYANGYKGQQDPTTQVDYNVFNSVTDLGLTSGSATITGAFNALPTDSVLITNEAEYASASRPATGWEGQIIICKGANLWRSYVEAKGNTASYGDYRMYLSSGAPTGAWLFQGAEGVVLFDDSSGATSGTLAEAVGNFNRVKVTWGPSDRGYLLTQEAYTHKASSFQIPLNYSTESSQNGNVFMSAIRIKFNGTAMTTDRNYNITIAPTSITSNAWSGRIFRVEGYYI